MAKDEKKKQYVRAAYAPDGPGAQKMLDALNEQGIDAFRQGGIKDIYKVGGDVFGEEIMVDPQDLARAQELLSQVTGTDSPPAKRSVSVKTTVLCLFGAAVLLVVLLIIRGRFLI